MMHLRKNDGTFTCGALLHPSRLATHVSDDVTCPGCRNELNRWVSTIVDAKHERVATPWEVADRCLVVAQEIGVKQHTVALALHAHGGSMTRAIKDLPWGRV